MPTPDPFAYPLIAHLATHAPAGYAEHTSYKPWLRDDFSFRCAYCLTRERWNPSGQDNFGADHVAARSAAPLLVTTYANLAYACNNCNSIKGVTPLPLNPLVEAVGFHVVVHQDGVAVALSVGGEAWIVIFRLSSDAKIAIRLEKLAALRAKLTHPDDADSDHLFRRAFGYPDDLPDLSALRPPGGNAVAGSESRSHFAQRSRGELDAVY